MKLCCPDNRVFYTEEISGFFLYRHEDDGSPCDYFNKFHITPLDVLKRFLKQCNYTYSPAIVAAIHSCDEVKEQLCEDLVNLSDEELAAQLRRIYRFCEKVGDYLLCESLHEEFGYVFMVNMLTVTGREYIPGRQRELPSTRKQRWKMRKLDPQRYGVIGREAAMLKKAQNQEKKKTLELYEELSRKLQKQRKR